MGGGGGSTAAASDGGDESTTGVPAAIGAGSAVGGAACGSCGRSFRCRLGGYRHRVAEVHLEVQVREVIDLRRLRRHGLGGGRGGIDGWWWSLGGGLARTRRRLFGAHLHLHRQAGGVDRSLAALHALERIREG